MPKIDGESFNIETKIFEIISRQNDDEAVLDAELKKTITLYALEALQNLFGDDLDHLTERYLVKARELRELHANMNLPENSPESSPESTALSAFVTRVRSYWQKEQKPSMWDKILNEQPIQIQNLEQMEELVSLFLGGLVNCDTVLDILCSPNRMAADPLHIPEIFRAALPMLERIGDESPDIAFYFLSSKAKEGDEGTPLHDESILRLTVPMLTKLAETRPLSVRRLLHIEDKHHRIIYAHDCLAGLRDSLETQYQLRELQEVETRLLDEGIRETPKFNFYTLIPADQKVMQSRITSWDTRPVHLLFRALGIKFSTVPADVSTFIWYGFEQAKSQLEKLDGILSVQANKDDWVIGWIRLENNAFTTEYSKETQVYGDRVFEIHADEVRQIVESQRIFLSPLIPKKFFMEFEKALFEDSQTNRVYPWIPRLGNSPISLNFDDLIGETNIYYAQLNALGKQVDQNPGEYGFNPEQYEIFKGLSLYQIGSMVVRRQDAILLVNERYQLRERKAGDNDVFRMIDISGIRDFHSTHTDRSLLREIMKNAFKTGLAAAEEGVIIFPAIGLGVWQGDPELYWGALLDAIIESPVIFKAIMINPAHQKLIRFQNKAGEEFETMLGAKLVSEELTDEQKEKLSKVKNLFKRQTDILLLAHELKRRFPNTQISIVNASDPDVVLGGITGEYAFHRNHPHTTEENFANVTTNALCFKQLTGAAENEAKVISVS